MAHSNKETIEIKDGVLYIDGAKRAALEKQRNGNIKFRFYPIGAFDLQEARVWLQGLLELSIHAEELENDKK